MAKMFYLVNLVGVPAAEGVTPEARAVALIRAKGTKRAMVSAAQERGGQPCGWIVARVDFHFAGIAHTWERVWP